MMKLRNNLFVGNERDASLLKFSNSDHITAVLNVAYEVNDMIYHPEVVRHIKIGLLDSAKNKTWMKDFAITTLIHLLRKKETVLIHCGAGLSRSPFVASFALAKIEHKDPHDIFQEIRNSRPFAQKNDLWLGYGYQPVGTK